MKLEFLKQQKNIIIVGYGLEGKSTERFLKMQAPNIKIKILDPVNKPLKFAPNAVYSISPGIDRQKLCADIPQKFCTSNAELFFENLTPKNREKTIGITGTKGKSTTTKFLAECLEIANKKVIIAGNYGYPLLDAFEKINKIDFLVAELSSYQLEFLNISPNTSIFLNIFADHLDRHKTLEKYTKIKMNVWNGEEKSANICFTPNATQKKLEEKNLWRLFQVKKLNTKIILTKQLSKSVFPQNSVFQAQHFCENFGTVQALLQNIFNEKETAKIIQKTAKKFKGLAHRIEHFTTKNSIDFYDDSISTNPDTSIAAIKFFSTRLGAIVLGGYSGGGTYNQLFKILQKTAPQAFVWVPKSNTKAEIIAAATKERFDMNKLITGDNFSALLKKEFSVLAKNTVVVLSPGAKSFDSFKNYKERGNAWKQAVNNI